MHFKHPYYENWLTQIQRPVRYAGNEYGQIRKSWNDTPHRMALAFPDLYEIGMSHMGLQVLYHAVNARPDMLCERVFMVWSDMEEALRSRSIPLVSLENARPLSDFHILGFSLQYELSYTNCLAMMDLAGLPLRAADRSDPLPLVCGGGPIAAHPEPIAPFFDFFFIGEAEEMLPMILEKESVWRKEGIDREERLRRLSLLPPCYVPLMHSTTESNGLIVVGGQDDPPAARRTWAKNLVTDEGRRLVPSVEAVFDRLSMEVMRGCTQGCRFCQAGMIYRPVRERSPLETATALKSGVTNTGWDEVSLTALSPADHSRLEDLFKLSADAARDCNVSLSMSSIRAYGLGDDLLDDLRTGRGGGLTFAPEAGTQRMRDLVNKNISTSDLIDTVGKVAQRGWSRIKLYFMIGLPEETDEDVLAIIQLVKEIIHCAKQKSSGRPPRITCAVSTFVPKPHTPLQWASMIDKDEVKRVQSLMRRDSRGLNMGLRFHPAETTFLEAVLCRGDRSLAPVIEDAFKLGCRFDGWEEKLNLSLWGESFEKNSIDPATMLKGRIVEDRVPWDHLDMGVKKSFLEKEHLRAMHFEPTKPCSAFDEKRGSMICHGCGVGCDLKELKKRAESGYKSEKNHRREVDPTSEEDGPEIRCRIRYQVDGPATLWGHLALVRNLPRALRRAGFKLRYSRGFHPKPQIVFPPPLPLGWKGLDETADVKVEAFPPAQDDLLGRVERACPEGFRIIDIFPIDEVSKPISKIVEGMEVILDVTTKHPHTNEEMQKKVGDFLKEPEIMRELRTGKKIRRIDLKTLIQAISVERTENSLLEKSTKWRIYITSNVTSGSKIIACASWIFSDILHVKATRTLILSDSVK